MENLRMFFGGCLGNFQLSLAREANVVHAQSREAQALLSRLAPSSRLLSNSAANGGRWKDTIKKLEKLTFTGSNVPYVPLAALTKMVVDVSMEGDAKDAKDRLLAVARGDDAGWKLEWEAAAARARAVAAARASRGARCGAWRRGRRR
jgi:hypothetical protein